MTKVTRTSFARHCSYYLASIPFLLLTLQSCQDNTQGSSPSIPLIQTPREAYQAALDSNGLGQTQMAKMWRAVGEAVLHDSILIEAPFREIGYFRAEDPSAVAYQLDLKTGELFHFGVSTPSDSVLLFIDLFQIVTQDSTEVLRARFNAENYQTDSLSYEVTESGIYILRIQPELLVSSRYTLSIVVQPTYGAFPVSGKGNRDIWSFFGDPRDGGRRDHKGVDIFARRGTPVVAAVDGTVRSVRDKGLGGKQVWLYDSPRRQSLYYAHLDSQLVAEGTLVQAGDTLGLVGNTGNARNTRPHLHFGIYRRGQGALDPHPFVARQSNTPPKVNSDTTHLGQFMRVRPRSTHLRAAPQPRSKTLATLNRHLPLRVEAASKFWFRVCTPEGLSGYLTSASLVSVDRPIQQFTAEQATELLAAPNLAAPAIASIETEEKIAVVGRNEDYNLVRKNNGLIAWMAIDDN